MLQDLSSKFQRAGESGDLSKLAPPRGGGSGGSGGAHGPRPAGPPPGGGGGGAGGVKGASSSSSATTEAADTNGDGKVSQAEQQAYDAEQALKGLDASSSNSETQRAANAYRKVPHGDGAPSVQKETSDVSSILERYAA